MFIFKPFIGFTLCMAAAVCTACANETSVAAPGPTLSGVAEDASRPAGFTWRLAELRSSDDAVGVVRPDDPAKYEMTLANDGRVAARLDCNRASGRYTVTPSTATAGGITFSPMAMTRAMCPPGSLDARIARELSFVRTYILEGDTLNLVLMADGGNQIWLRAAPATDGNGGN